MEFSVKHILVSIIALSALSGAALAAEADSHFRAMNDQSYDQSYGPAEDVNTLIALPASTSILDDGTDHTNPSQLR
jgi:hypothetical protein